MNRLRAVLTPMLVAFVWVTVGFYGGRATAPAAPPPAAPAPHPAAVEPVLRVWYVHGDDRCETCNRMETWTREAFERGWKDELAAGRVVLSLLNRDRDENLPYVDEFQLVSGTVVLAGPGAPGTRRWKNLQRVWDLAHDHDAFLAYLDAEAKAFLAPTGGP